MLPKKHNSMFSLVDGFAFRVNFMYTQIFEISNHMKRYVPGHSC